jgi:hypothetical protein
MNSPSVGSLRSTTKDISGDSQKLRIISVLVQSVYCIRAVGDGETRRRWVDSWGSTWAGGATAGTRRWRPGRIGRATAGSVGATTVAD